MSYILVYVTLRTYYWNVINKIRAPSKDAQVVEHVALVDVDALVLVAESGMHVAHVALTPERSCRHRYLVNKELLRSTKWRGYNW